MTQGEAMKPHENEQLGVRRAINAHEDAAAALADLIINNPDPVYDEIMQRVEQNLAALRLKDSAAGA